MDYAGDGTDLVLLRKVHGEWEELATHYDSATRSVALPGVTNLFTLVLPAIARLAPPWPHSPWSSFSW